jgi:Flp pilus assembly pilin Flp
MFGHPFTSAGHRVLERGQTTAEYALVLLGVGAVAMLVVAWASKTNKIGQLLDAVFKSLTNLVA